MQNKIEDYLFSLGVENAKEKCILLEKYVDELMLFNPTLKLVGSKERDDIILRHIFDSAAAYPIFKRETKCDMNIADLGSGAGLPGLVLAILFEDRNFFLIERMQRRVGFLRSTIALLKLRNVSVIDKDIKEAKGSFDYLTCRAFHPIVDIASDAIKLSKNAIFYKGTEANIGAEIASLKKQGYKFVSVIEPITVPGLSEMRNIVILKDWER